MLKAVAKVTIPRKDSRMLVLSRKIGQQVVLPEHGITIDVVDLCRTHVRLGISAPSDIPVHRREVWDRVQDTGNGSPTANGSSLDRHEAVDEPNNAMPLAPSLVDLDNSMARWIAKRTCGRIRQLSVETRDGRIVIRGYAGSFYARQLVQAAVQEILDVCDVLPSRLVEYRIEINGDGSRSNVRSEKSTIGSPRMR
jgi:carbon storage regulator